MLNPSEFSANQSNLGVWSIFSLLAIYMSFYFFQSYSGKLHGYFTKYGQDSMIIYLVHVPIASVMRIMLFKLGVDSLILQLFLGTLITWFLCILAVNITRKVPLISKIFYPLK